MNQIQNVNNWKRNHYKTDIEGSIRPIIEINSNLIEKNEINEINNIIQQVYTYMIGQKDGNEYISDLICQKIKHKIHGEWFVLVSDKEKDIPFSFSTVSQSDFLTITLGKTKFQIVKLK